MSSMSSDYELLTPKEVCKMLHIHQATLYKLIRKGKLPSFKIGGDWRFRTDLLESWMAEQMLKNLRALPARRKPRLRRQRGGY
jgi:excisionase family DNA binding protein